MSHSKPRHSMTQMSLFFSRNHTHGVRTRTRTKQQCLHHVYLFWVCDEVCIHQEWFCQLLRNHLESTKFLSVKISKLFSSRKSTSVVVFSFTDLALKSARFTACPVVEIVVVVHICTVEHQYNAQHYSAFSHITRLGLGPRYAFGYIIIEWSPAMSHALTELLNA